jgi:ferredoxin
MKKGNYHFRLKDRERLAALIVDINKTVKPDLAIFDALDAMEGDGPSGGEPRRLGLLMASADLTALDVTACRVIDLDPATVPTIIAARTAGYGTADPAAIEIIGESIDRIRVPDFKKVEHFKSVLGILPLPQFMLKWLRELWAPRPRINPDLCISCYRCRDGCPVTPPAIDPDRPSGSQVHDKTCIRCYCCHEFCPVKAIDLKHSLADRILNFSRLFEWASRKLGKLLARISI